MALLDTWRRRHTEALDAAEVERLTWAWREACEGAGCCHRVDTATGPTVTTPRVTSMTLGPPTVLIVRLLPGQVARDLQRVSYRLAGRLGARGLRVEPRGTEWARVELVHEDPLTATVPLVLPRRGREVLIGRSEEGGDVEQDWRDAPHAIVQGVTRSGKSVWTYGLLAQLAPQPDIVVAGLDPTALLLRPFAGSRHAQWHASGLADPAAHEVLLERLVAEMDRRIAELPDDRDTLDVDERRPLMVIVLEEYPGLLRALDAERERGKRIRALVARLLAESAKVGMRVVILAQRAEAAVVGSFERAMCSLRISFRVDNRASADLLHPGIPPEIADPHTSAQPGVALMSAPGRPLERIRGPWIGGYAEYAAAIRSAGA